MNPLLLLLLLLLATTHALWQCPMSPPQTSRAHPRGSKVFAVHAIAGTNLVASGDNDGNVKIYDVSLGFVTQNFYLPGISTTYAIASTARSNNCNATLIVACGDSTACFVFDYITGNYLLNYTGHKRTVRSIAIQDLAKPPAPITAAITSDETGTIHVWDVATGLAAASFPNPANPTFHAITSINVVDGLVFWSGIDLVIFYMNMSTLLTTPSVKTFPLSPSPNTGPFNPQSIVIDSTYAYVSNVWDGTITIFNWKNLSSIPTTTIADNVALSIALAYNSGVLVYSTIANQVKWKITQPKSAPIYGHFPTTSPAVQVTVGGDELYDSNNQMLGWVAAGDFDGNVVIGCLAQTSGANPFPPFGVLISLLPFLLSIATA